MWEWLRDFRLRISLLVVYIHAFSAVDIVLLFEACLFACLFVVHTLG